MRDSMNARWSQAADAVLESNDSAVRVPNSLLFGGEFKRVGDSLKITGTDGTSVLVQDYFKTDRPPTLVTPDGASLSAATVTTLAGPRAPGQYAQAGWPPPHRKSVRSTRRPAA